MKKMLGRGLFLAVCLLMALGLAVPAMAAAPTATYPGLFYGTAAVDDEPVAAGTEITAWVGSEQVGSALTGEGTLDPDQYTLTVELEAADVSFKIGELDALVNGNPTIPFKMYEPVEANLTAYTVPHY